MAFTSIYGTAGMKPPPCHDLYSSTQSALSVHEAEKRKQLNEQIAFSTQPTG
jgi:hypothetical protein